MNPNKEVSLIRGGITSTDNNIMLNFIYLHAFLRLRAAIISLVPSSFFNGARCGRRYSQNSMHSLHNLIPFLIYRLMIQFTQNETQPDWHGYFYTVLFFLTALVQSLFLHQYFHRAFIIGMRIRTAVIAAVYNKVYNISGVSR